MVNFALLPQPARGAVRGEVVPAGPIGAARMRNKASG